VASDGAKALLEAADKFPEGPGGWKEVKAAKLGAALRICVEALEMAKPGKAIIWEDAQEALARAAEEVV
jgi:hypothetical protein